jgi:putative sigma-54 modulation protein
MSRKTKAAEFLEMGYDINVTGRHVLVTDAMKDYAMEKISRIERLSTRIIYVNVIMDIQREDQRVEIIARVNNTKIRSQACTPDMYFSIDKAVNKLTEQLRRYKERLQDYHQRPVDTEMNVNVYQTIDQNEVNDEIESENRRQEIDAYAPHQIVKQEKRPLKTLNCGESIHEMDLSGDLFMIFRSEEDRKIKVIYRRQDGNYGIIETE